MIRWGVLLACVLTAAPALGQEVTLGSGAVLRALDKFSGQVTDLRVLSGETAEFARLSIRVGECRYPSENPASDAFAYMEVSETGRSDLAFAGWMIASSPALSALDHARYDVWLMRCTIS